MTKLALADVTLVAIDTVAHELTRLALEDCLAKAQFGDAMVFSDRPITAGDTRWIETPPLRSWEAVGKVWWHELPRHIETSHYLMIQYDSWMLAAEAWNPLWLQCDYIGAPWPWHWQHRVGNGGFSLRSRRLAQHLADHAERFPVTHPEDDTLCRRYRPQLEAEGFRWAAEHDAARFSFERGRPRVATFGFHGLFNWPFVLRCDDLERRLCVANDFVRGKPEWQEMLRLRQRMMFTVLEPAKAAAPFDPVAPKAVGVVQKKVEIEYSTSTLTKAAEHTAQ